MATASDFPFLHNGGLHQGLTSESGIRCASEAAMMAQACWQVAGHGARGNTTVLTRTTPFLRPAPSPSLPTAVRALAEGISPLILLGTASSNPGVPRLASPRGPLLQSSRYLPSGVSRVIRYSRGRYRRCREGTGTGTGETVRDMTR
jgi:hypothetical protein